NWFHDGDMWVSVDLESGVPTVTTAQYLIKVLRMGASRLFDSSNVTTLSSYVGRDDEPLRQPLGSQRLLDLRQMITELEPLEDLWKPGEIALLREPRRWA